MKLTRHDGAIINVKGLRDERHCALTFAAQEGVQPIEIVVPCEIQGEFMVVPDFKAPDGSHCGGFTVRAFLDTLKLI